MKVAYDEELAELSPSNLLMADLVRNCCERPDVASIDLVTNQPWHARWHAEVLPHVPGLRPAGSTVSGAPGGARRRRLPALPALTRRSIFTPCRPRPSRSPAPAPGSPAHRRLTRRAPRGLRVGRPGAPPLVLAHGGFDFARTFDVFAPLLADAGWRVVAWDQRGPRRLRARRHVLLGGRPRDAPRGRRLGDHRAAAGRRPLEGRVGHGAVRGALPHRVSALVNLDGVPSGRSMPDVPDHERTKLLAGELAGWLDFRRRAGTKQRRPDTLDGLAERRAVG